MKRTEGICVAMGREGKRCAAPFCTAALRSDNTSGLCRDHLHWPGRCACRQCTGTARNSVIVLTRAQLVAAGLLPGVTATCA